MKPARTRPSVRPVRRRTFLAGVAVLVSVLAAVLWGVDQLRHPLPGERPETPDLDEPSADPRFEVQCPEPQPVEGQPRDQATLDLVEPPQPVTSSELYDCPQSWHERAVRYQGEVVGGVLERGGGAWVQLNDDVYADAAGPLPVHRDYAGGNAGIGVFIPADLADQITWTGGPGRQGDLIEVVGTFRRVDRDSREAAVIVAQEGSVLRAGSAIDNPTLPDRRVTAFVLALLAVAAVAAERLVAARRRG